MYYKKIITAGQFITVKKIYSARKGSHSCRSPNIRATPKDVMAQNDKLAAEKLGYLLNANFRKGQDGHLTLTYEQAPTPQEARKAVENFLRSARKAYRKAGIELKYVQVTEYKSHRIHHHIVFNSIAMYSQLTEIWKHGIAHLKALYSDDLSQLGDYLVKETQTTFRSEDKLFGRRWTSSRNLVQPKIEYEKISSGKWRSKPPESFRNAKIIPAETVNGYSEFDGRPYQVAVYRRI